MSPFLIFLATISVIVLILTLIVKFVRYTVLLASMAAALYYLYGADPATQKAWDAKANRTMQVIKQEAIKIGGQLVNALPKFDSLSIGKI